MPACKVGVQLHPQATPIEDLREAWKAADALGIDSLWVWDHFYPLYGDPDAPHFEAYTLLAAMAADTKNARIGARCKISSHSFICEGVTIEDEVFIGHGVMFTNDLRPRATAGDGKLQTEADWQVIPTVVKKGASIGSGAVILCGITIGERAMIGAGAVVTRDVPADTTVAGVPARVRARTPSRKRRPDASPFTHQNAQIGRGHV